MQCLPTVKSNIRLAVGAESSYDDALIRADAMAICALITLITLLLVPPRPRGGRGRGRAPLWVAVISDR